MKKLFKIFFLLALVLFNFVGCIKMNSDEKYLIYYNGNYYDSYITDDYTYNSFWYTLCKADITDTAYTCNKNDNLSELGKNEIEIQRFSDEELSMFILHNDFWGEWLYCNIDYKMPEITVNNIEKIVLKKATETSEWIDYYNSDTCIALEKQNDINTVLTSLKNRKTNKNSYDFNEVKNQTEVCIKFQGINALYYIGIIAFVDDNVVFYNSHEKINSFYLLYDNNSENPFDALN